MSNIESTPSGDNFLAKCTGRVKWFNSKTGYGFITITGGDESLAQKDVFVHHSAINTGSKLYKYLVQGEYVCVDVGKTSGGQHEYQIMTVSGIDGGMLMCETRHSVSSGRPRGSSSRRRSNIPTLESQQHSGITSATTETA